MGMGKGRPESRSASSAFVKKVGAYMKEWMRWGFMSSNFSLVEAALSVFARNGTPIIIKASHCSDSQY